MRYVLVLIAVVFSFSSCKSIKPTFSIHEDAEALRILSKWVKLDAADFKEMKLGYWPGGFAQDREQHYFRFVGPLQTAQKIITQFKFQKF